jgi:hypothetical protein
VTWVIGRCLTAREVRGRGLYPRTLATVRAGLPATDQAVIYTHAWDAASRRGILKAGFQPFARRVRRDGRVWFEALQAEPEPEPARAAPSK